MTALRTEGVWSEMSPDEIEKLAKQHATLASFHRSLSDLVPRESRDYHRDLAERLLVEADSIRQRILNLERT